MHATAEDGVKLYYEEPEAFNRLLPEFLYAAEAGRWSPRDPPSLAPGVHGMR